MLGTGYVGYATGLSKASRSLAVAKSLRGRSSLGHLVFTFSTHGTLGIDALAA